MIDETKHAGAYKIIMWSGVALMLLAATYLSIVSVMAHLSPATLERILGCDVGEVYSHPVLFVLFVLLGLVMLLATLLYVPLDWAHGGAWLSHSGIVTLIVGAAGYALLVQQGQCITIRIDDGPGPAQWSPISYFEPIRGGKIQEPVPLGVTLQVVETQFVSRGSMPGDYICKVQVDQGPGAGEQTLSLNNPIRAGRFQVTQGSWLPQSDPGNPRQIVFLVATRPLIGIIWLGMGMSVAGMLLGFYSKPLIARRRRGAYDSRPGCRPEPTGETPIRALPVARDGPERGK